jgi:hypothetical protein
VVPQKPPADYTYDFFKPPYVKVEPQDPNHIFSPSQPAPWVDASPTYALPLVKSEPVGEQPFSNPFGHEVWYNVEPGLEYDASDYARLMQALNGEQMDLVSDGGDSLPTLETVEPPEVETGKEVLQSDQPSDLPAPGVVVPFIAVDRGVAEAKEEDRPATVNQLMHGDSGALHFTSQPAGDQQVVLHAEPQMQLITPGTQQKRMVGSLGGRKKERDAEGNLLPPPIDYDPNPPALNHEKTIYHDNGHQHKREWRQDLHAGKMVKGSGHDQSKFVAEEPDWDYNVYEPQDEYEPDGQGGWKHDHHID